MANQVQHKQTGTPVSHWQAVICCESGPSGQPIPLVPHPLKLVCYQAASPHSSHYRCIGRHSFSFLPSWNGTGTFLHPTQIAAENVELFTDSTGTWCGAYFKSTWLDYPWQPYQLFAVVKAALMWDYQWHGQKIRFHSDNNAIVLAW